MPRTFTAILLLLAFTPSVQAQKKGAWASARERGLKGEVRTVLSICSDSRGKYKTTFKYEFDRDGKLVVITTPQFPRCVHINSLPVSYKITKRNGRGDVEEVAMVLEGDVLEKERYEYEYDNVGNWIKLVTFHTRTYETVGDNWKAGEWRTFYVCIRTIGYYP